MSGAAVNAFAYEAHGVMIASNGPPQTAYLYSGYQFDPETGFYYLLARYYDPNLARFLTRDVVEGFPARPLTLNQYAYVCGNPVNFLDPAGREATAIETGTAGTLSSRLASQLLLATLKTLTVACAAEFLYTTAANVAFNQDTTSHGSPCSWRGKSRERVLYHYSVSPTLTGGTIWSGTWLTDRANLTAAEARFGLGITSGFPTTIYAIRVKSDEIQGGNLVSTSINAPWADSVLAREWVTLVSLPATRVQYILPILE